MEKKTIAEWLSILCKELKNLDAIVLDEFVLKAIDKLNEIDELLSNCLSGKLPALKVRLDSENTKENELVFLVEYEGKHQTVIVGPSFSKEYEIRFLCCPSNRHKEELREVFQKTLSLSTRKDRVLF